MSWSKKELERELTFEEFQEEMLRQGLEKWISARPRTLLHWLYSVEAWAQGHH